MHTKRPWTKNYPDFVPPSAEVGKYENLVHLIDENTKKYHNDPSFYCFDKSLTYGEIGAYSDAFASYLQNQTDLKKGDRIAIQLPNILQFPIALFGAIKAGLIVVNTNPLYTPHEMEHQFKDSGAKAIVILENFCKNLESIIENTNIQTVVTTKIGDQVGGLKGAVINTVVKHIKKMVPPFSLPNAITFKSILEDNKGKKPNKFDIDRNDIAFLQYTGGTTGLSKGAQLSHHNIVSNIMQCHSWIGNLFDQKGEIVITALPLYHIFALTINCMLFYTTGAKNILVTNPRDMNGFMKILKKYPMNYITGVNTLFNGMMNHPAFSSLNFDQLKLSVGGGMAIQKVVADRWKKITGVDLLEGYGLSETSPVASFAPLGGNHKIGYIGTPVPDTDMAIFDDHQNILPQGEHGEIGVKGPQVHKGYWNKGEENSQYFTKDGYFLTGDIGFMDEDFFFKIIDRKKEMINVSGFNVYPNEVEKVISEHPKVLEVGVTGVEDTKSTESVAAFIVKRDASLTQEEIKALCKEKLTNYKVPKHIHFRESLPKSNVGKILRRKLK